MDRKEIIDLMKDRGFTLTMESRKGDNGDGNPSTYYFMSEPETHRHKKNVIITPVFTCTVYPDSNEFSFSYPVPKSLNILEAPKCGSFDNDDHFCNICDKFESAVKVLFHAFKED